MKKSILSGLKILLAFTLLTGMVYPLIVSGIAQAVFPRQSNGSIISIGQKSYGSELLGQEFKSDHYFWSRPSACSYATLPSGASNWSPTSDTLRKTIEKRRESFILANHLPLNTVVPNEMLTASGSGLDPHISPESAELQIGRVALARHFSTAQLLQLHKLVARHAEPPQFGCLGEKRVNVLQLNRDLDLLK
ncbi:potassium-transporting ATPase subunit KdpC [Paludibacter jiangxiensis]|uniref:Potassium-transporting ATPase KdpC subunit n=1 Tax=Paludibacter jiangxiensis TaxID=681398 RepID=A0A170ZC76_9BACT|nr:potassium-transporting ATPase subunit KdpC [Paludibacter jiangxiensis]GAT62516.1 K+-transporting ATPase ATPase C chain [Paludibacter jiangxiensis]